MAAVHAQIMQIRVVRLILLKEEWLYRCIGRGLTLSSPPSLWKLSLCIITHNGRASTHSVGPLLCSTRGILVY
jgi:hypothetical protein